MNTENKQNDFLGLASEIFEIVSNGIENRTYSYPKTNTSENDSDFKIEIYYPGMKKENFKIKIENKTISISSILPEEKEEEKYYFREFHKRKFNRTFALPENIIKAKISASYEDGVLKILIPKDKVKEKESNFEIEIK